MKKTFTVLALLLSFTSIYAQEEAKAQKVRTRSNHSNEKTASMNIANTMPNRISMNVTVGSQIHKIEVLSTKNNLLLNFGKGGGYWVNLAEKQIETLNPNEIKAKISNGLQQAGGAVAEKTSNETDVAIMQIIIKGPDKEKGGVTNSGAKIQANIKITEQENDLGTLPENGEYEMTLVVEKATSGLKDTLKTQVRLGFTVEDSQLKTKHDTVKNTINNVR
jgi:hypothetical protein